MKQSHKRGYEKAMTDVRACDEGRKKGRWRTPPVPQDLRSNRAGNLAAISPDESPLSHEFRAKYRGKAIFAFATWQMRNVLSRVTPNRAETPRGRARLFPASASRRGRHRLGAASSSSEQLDDRRRARVLPGRRLETSGMFAGASSPRCCSASARARRGATRGRGGPRLAFLCVSGTTARARAARGRPPRRAGRRRGVRRGPPDEQMARRDLSSEVSVSIDEDASVWRVSGPKSPPVRLLTSYDEVVRAIVAEMDRTAAGDRVEFSVYVMEPGASRTPCCARCAAPRAGRSRGLLAGLFGGERIHQLVRARPRRRRGSRRWRRRFQT